MFELGEALAMLGAALYFLLLMFLMVWPDITKNKHEDNEDDSIRGWIRTKD